MIVASAVWHQGRLFAGLRHNNAIHIAVMTTGIKPVKGEEGFLTDQNVFLNRKQAADHALACGQIKLGDKDIGGRTFTPGKLYSEDIFKGNDYQYEPREITTVTQPN
jgi:hypothetical protein